MRPEDTQFEILRRMTPGERWQAAQHLSWSARRLKAAHVRALNPTWSEEQVQQDVKATFMHVRA